MIPIVQVRADNHWLIKISKTNPIYYLINHGWASRTLRANSGWWWLIIIPGWQWWSFAQMGWTLVFMRWSEFRHQAMPVLPVPGQVYMIFPCIPHAGIEKPIAILLRGCIPIVGYQSVVSLPPIPTNQPTNPSALRLPLSIPTTELAASATGADWGEAWEMLGTRNSAGWCWNVHWLCSIRLPWWYQQNHPAVHSYYVY